MGTQQGHNRDIAGLIFGPVGLIAGLIFSPISVYFWFDFRSLLFRALFSALLSDAQLICAV